MMLPPLTADTAGPPGYGCQGVIGVTYFFVPGELELAKSNVGPCRQLSVAEMRPSPPAGGARMAVKAQSHITN